VSLTGFIPLSLDLTVCAKSNICSYMCLLSCIVTLLVHVCVVLLTSWTLQFVLARFGSDEAFDTLLVPSYSYTSLYDHQLDCSSHTEVSRVQPNCATQSIFWHPDTLTLRAERNPVWHRMLYSHMLYTHVAFPAAAFQIFLCLVTRLHTVRLVVGLLAYNSLASLVI